MTLRNALMWAASFGILAWSLGQGKKGRYYLVPVWENDQQNWYVHQTSDHSRVAGPFGTKGSAEDWEKAQ